MCIYCVVGKDVLIVNGYIGVVFGIKVQVINVVVIFDLMLVSDLEVQDKVISVDVQVIFDVLKSGVIFKDEVVRKEYVEGLVVLV